jgi:hypothetical protein
MTVIITPRGDESIAATFLPAPIRQAMGCDRAYRLYRCDLDAPTLLEDVDGRLLVETRTFPDEDTAVRWVEAHEKQRRLMHGARVKA